MGLLETVVFVFFVTLLASGIAAYGPPTSQNAYDAITDRILVLVRESGDVLYEDELAKRPEFPSDIVIQRCAKKNNRATKLESGYIKYLGGYDCLVEVRPNGDPPYTTAGFFRHNGFEWEYHGPVREPNNPIGIKFLDQEEPGEFILKEGSLPYEGDPANPLNPSYNPYQALFPEVDVIRERQRGRR